MRRFAMLEYTKHFLFCAFLILAATPSFASALPPAEVPAETIDQEPTGILTLARACAATLASSPILEGFSWELRASEARLLQAGLRKNPTLDVSVEDVAGTKEYRGAQQAQNTIWLGQVIELGGKRAARREVASVAKDLTVAEYEVKRVEVLATLAERFITLLAAQHEVELANAGSKLAETVLSTVRARIRAGKNSALEEKKALVAVSRQRLVTGNAEHQLAIARTNLAASWGSTEPGFQRAEGSLFAVTKLPGFEELAATVNASPEVLRWVTEQRLRAAEVALARSGRVPDLTVSGGYRRLEGPDAQAFVFQFSVPLPLFDRGQGSYAEAQARQHSAAIDIRSATVRLHSSLFGFYQELGHSAVALARLESDILPQAEAALTLSELGFREGRFSYLELLDAQRTFVDLRRERIETAADYQKELLAIERLLGQPICDAGALEHDIKR